MVLFLCTLSDDVYICTKFCENILNSFKVREQTRFLDCKLARENIIGDFKAIPVKNVDGVTVLILCSLSDDALYYVQVL